MLNEDSKAQWGKIPELIITGSGNVARQKEQWIAAPVNRMGDLTGWN